MKTFINSIALPNKYWITPSNNHQSNKWMKNFNQKLTQNIKLIQLRSKTKINNNFIQQLHNKCKQHNVKLLLNIVNKTFNEAYCDGWNLTTDEMLKFNKRPCANNKLLGISTHNLTEALKAQKIGADFIIISPVQATRTHPELLPLGWDSAKEIVNTLNIPVYFLGGMKLQDLKKTHQLGAQGIAGVSTF
ncbi:thiamine phosphate synthase [Candidatus Vesicomyidisocius sp. SY067_SCS001]|uniref:thiamine phosphate synthase n=1 Tax=Candidatus Vesicomyidisocius sp. SY067_SCS001 TaxID=2732590 RepID=UPI00168355C0|nr:thiamine phosphate synthase [Candidatus Vesicomyosocius sp. SY067_SCS001]